MALKTDDRTLDATTAKPKLVPDPGNSGGSTLERVTVNLTPRAIAALEALIASTGDSKTDVVNRALQVYAHVQAVMDDGGRLYTREAGSDELERLRFL